MRTVRDMVKNDEMWTPPEATNPLIQYLDNSMTIWEMCPGSGQMVDYFVTRGYNVLWHSGKDALHWSPPEWWDVAVTNPPWSKKHLFLERCIKLDDPFALLLPVRTLGVRRCQIWLDDCDFLFLPKRIDYTGGNSPYEASLWVTRKLLPNRVVFAPPESMNAYVPAGVKFGP